ncbi:acyl-CoA dehydrogenase [Conexibacter sp. W3-3-2]|uniref:Butyryl-CoA dehydrogenase n=1 Tax=Paraconexibacter algicola TaxID=2133960 RepID=A0A2T4UG10_9ACTN|nr:acyl-CoA dehydrogenase [Conexibacter sp. W3-3-2]PTL58155.1 butyryl-CoA dehydrogenase [Paraconexibacter algicola]
MGLGLQALRKLASFELIDRVGLRGPTEQIVYQASKNGFKGATVAGRTFARVSGAGKPTRARVSGGSDLFDLTPDDDQQMLVEVMREVAAGELRPAALKADEACAAPQEVLDQGTELGLALLGVPEDLGGTAAERSAVTTVLVTEQLAHGDMGLTVALLGTSAVSTALGLWGDADQQATYMPAFTGDDVPCAAFAVLEPQPLFDPFALKTTARLDGEGYVLDGVKSMVARAADAEVLLVAAHLEGHGPALFLVSSGETSGLTVEANPAMGLRAAATETLHLEGVKVGPDALLAQGDPAVYAQAIHRARLGWCAATVGTAQAVLDLVIPYVNERVAFGEPVSHRQAVAFAVSDIAIELEGMRLATYRAASLADQDKDFAHATAIARQLCATKGMYIGSQGVQLLGGAGYIKEYPVERWYRDLRATGVMEGALLV